MALERRQFIGVGSGANSEPASFSGLDREIVVNTDKSTIRVYTTQKPDGVDLAKDSDLATLADRVIVNEAAISTKQDELISGVNIKTINGESIKGSGNLVISSGSGASVIGYSLIATSVTWNPIPANPGSNDYPPNATHYTSLWFSHSAIKADSQYMPIALFSYSTLANNPGLLLQCDGEVSPGDTENGFDIQFYASNPSQATTDIQAMLILLEITDETFASLSAIGGLANS